MPDETVVGNNGIVFFRASGEETYALYIALSGTVDEYMGAGEVQVNGIRQPGDFVPAVKICFVGIMEFDGVPIVLKPDGFDLACLVDTVDDDDVLCQIHDRCRMV